MCNNGSVTNRNLLTITPAVTLKSNNPESTNPSEKVESKTQNDHKSITTSDQKTDGTKKNNPKNAVELSDGAVNAKKNSGTHEFDSQVNFPLEKKQSVDPEKVKTEKELKVNESNTVPASNMAKMAREAAVNNNFERTELTNFVKNDLMKFINRLSDSHIPIGSLYFKKNINVIVQKVNSGEKLSQIDLNFLKSFLSDASTYLTQANKLAPSEIKSLSRTLSSVSKLVDNISGFNKLEANLKISLNDVNQKRIEFYSSAERVERSVDKLNEELTKITDPELKEGVVKVLTSLNDQYKNILREGNEVKIILFSSFMEKMADTITEINMGEGTLNIEDVMNKHNEMLDKIESRTLTDKDLIAYIGADKFEAIKSALFNNVSINSVESISSDIEKMKKLSTKINDVNFTKEQLFKFVTGDLKKIQTMLRYSNDPKKETIEADIKQAISKVNETGEVTPDTLLLLKNISKKMDDVKFEKLTAQEKDKIYFMLDGMDGLIERTETLNGATDAHEGKSREFYASVEKVTQSLDKIKTLISSANCPKHLKDGLMSVFSDLNERFTAVVNTNNNLDLTIFSCLMEKMANIGNGKVSPGKLIDDYERILDKMSSDKGVTNKELLAYFGPEKLTLINRLLDEENAPTGKQNQISLLPPTISVVGLDPNPAMLPTIPLLPGGISRPNVVEGIVFDEEPPAPEKPGSEPTYDDFDESTGNIAAKIKQHWQNLAGIEIERTPVAVLPPIDTGSAVANMLANALLPTAAMPSSNGKNNRPPVVPPTLRISDETKRKAHEIKPHDIQNLFRENPNLQVAFKDYKNSLSDLSVKTTNLSIARKKLKQSVNEMDKFSFFRVMNGSKHEGFNKESADNLAKAGELEAKIEKVLDKVKELFLEFQATQEQQLEPKVDSMVLLLEKLRFIIKDQDIETRGGIQKEIEKSMIDYYHSMNLNDNKQQNIKRDFVRTELLKAFNESTEVRKPLEANKSS